MRDIKYRGLSKNGWVYGIPFYSPGTGIWQIVHSNGWVPTYDNPDEGESNVFVPVDPLTITPFVKNVYEFGEMVPLYIGDIIEYDTEDGFWRAVIEEVETSGENDGLLKKVIERPLYRLDKRPLDGLGEEYGFAICGNIYENKELLKQ